MEMDKSLDHAVTVEYLCVLTAVSKSRGSSSIIRPNVGLSSHDGFRPEDYLFLYKLMIIPAQNAKFMSKSSRLELAQPSSKGQDVKLVFNEFVQDSVSLTFLIMSLCH